SATVVSFDPGETDWPLKASFVLFMRNVVEATRMHRAQGASGPVTTGDPLRVAVPPDVTRVKVRGPGLADLDVAAKGGCPIVPSVERGGVYDVRWLAPHVGAIPVIAANLTSERESDVHPKPIVLEESGESGGATRAPDAQNDWAPWLALLAALV